MSRKSIPFADIQFKADKPGTFRARIATLNAVDKDADVTLPGAFPDGKAIVISAYGHKSWDGALPVGKGVIGSDQSQAWVDGEFFLNTMQGKETYETVKALAAAGLGEWSHGYQVLESSTEPGDLSAYPGAAQILKKLDLWEASPVLVGAGVNTATERIKSPLLMIAGAGPLKARALAARMKVLSPDAVELETVAKIDLLADEMDGLVETLMDQFEIPELEDLAAGEPDEAKSFSFVDHASHALAGVQAFVSRGKSLADLRAKKQQKEGRVLSVANRERLAALAEGLNGALTDISELLSATEPEAAKSADDEELNAIWLQLQRRAAGVDAA
jgi:hypothetical protein